MGRKTIPKEQLAMDFTANTPQLTVAYKNPDFENTILSQNIQSPVDVLDKISRLFSGIALYKRFGEKRDTFERKMTGREPEYKTTKLRRFFEKSEYHIALVNQIYDSLQDDNMKYFMQHRVPHEYIKPFFVSTHGLKKKEDYKNEGYTIPEFIQGLKHKSPEMELYLTAITTNRNPGDLALERENKRWWSQHCAE